MNVAGAGTTVASTGSRSTEDFRKIIRGPQNWLLRSRRQFPARDDERNKGDGCSDRWPARRGLLNLSIHSRTPDRGCAYEREMGF